MINLDDITLDDLREFVLKCEQDKKSLGLSIFPDKPAGWMKTMNLLEHYAKAKIEAIQDRFNGQIQRALTHEQNECDKYYRALPDYARW